MRGVADAFKFSPGMDSRDMMKCKRDQFRRQADIMRTDIRRPNDLFSPKSVSVNLRRVKPVISTRGTDIRHIVQEGRKKAQYNKAVGNLTQLREAPTRVYKK